VSAVRFRPCPQGVSLLKGDTLLFSLPSFLVVNSSVNTVSVLSSVNNLSGIQFCYKSYRRKWFGARLEVKGDTNLMGRWSIPDSDSRF
jgi:hypothetical protein